MPAISLHAARTSARHAVGSAANARASSAGTPSPFAYAAPARAQPFASFRLHAASQKLTAELRSPASAYVDAASMHDCALPALHERAQVFASPGLHTAVFGG